MICRLRAPQREDASVAIDDSLRSDELIVGAIAAALAAAAAAGVGRLAPVRYGGFRAG